MLLLPLCAPEPLNLEVSISHEVAVGNRLPSVNFSDAMERYKNGFSLIHNY